MTYDKETRNELMNQEIMEDKIEHLNEINDGRKEVWIFNNHESLVNEFIEESKSQFKEFCEIRWRECNE